MERHHNHDHSATQDCMGKVPYKTPAAAAKAKRALDRRVTARQHHGMRPFRCMNCNNWHLGRLPKANLRKQKRRAIREGYDPSM